MLSSGESTRATDQDKQCQLLIHIRKKPKLDPSISTHSFQFCSSGLVHEYVHKYTEVYEKMLIICPGLTFWRHCITHKLCSINVMSRLLLRGQI